jgi:hypothetical protein
MGSGRFQAKKFRNSGPLFRPNCNLYMGPTLRHLNRNAATPQEAFNLSAQAIQPKFRTP